jgi:hypothetical protein
MTHAARSALIADGYQIKIWQGREKRYYLTDSYGQQVGYLTDDDDGSTGTCKNVTRRAGHVASLLRNA